METSEKTVLDYCSKIKLFNNHVLVCVEGKVSTLQLTTLASEQGAANSNVIDKFFKELAKNDKVIVKVSDKVSKEYPELSIGDSIVFNSYGNPTAIFNSDDPCELDNVINAFKNDSKDPKFKDNTIGLNYKVRCYYTFEAHSIIFTKSI